MSIKTVLKSKALQELMTARKLRLVSTETQLANGTIALVGKIKKQPVSYKITATGAVLSNEFVARRVDGTTPAALYKNGIAAVAELAAKRAAR